MNQSIQTLIKPRVLIVDNDLRTCELLQERITRWGYTAILAHGTGDALLNDAVQKAREHRCQIAVVDMRLRDDFDPDDRSGLELIARLQPAESIILSGHGNDQVVSNILEDYGAVSYVGKQYGTTLLHEKLDRAAGKICAAKKNLMVDFPDPLDEILLPLFGTSDAEYCDQFYDALARLFPEARELRLEKLGKDHESSNFVTVPRPKSVILVVYEKAEGTELQPVVVKLARREKIEKEIERYKAHIRRRLVGRYNATMEENILLWDIGAAIYTYVGDATVRPFALFFQMEELDKIQRCLESFFKESWKSHYENKVPRQKIPLFDWYDKVWDKWYERKLKEFSYPAPQQLMAGNLIERLQPIDPVAWFKQNIFDRTRPIGIFDTHTAITHGDLHGDNLLVDEQNNAWVIDFERTEEGHILQDFIELESDIINRLTCSSDNFASFHQLCLLITGQDAIGALPVSGAFLQDAQASKALATISIVRSLVKDCTGIDDIKEYLLGLYFNSLFRATIVPDDKCRERALMLASVICHRLEHWGEAWPPAEWTSMD